MKKLVNKTKGLVRGTSTAVLLSVAIHAALFFGAGVWVVFRFIDARQANFVPQKIDRPKMKLKKLRVKVKEQAKPRKTTQRIASSRKSSDLPDIQLPEMTGMGAGLEGAIGGFDMMADLSSMTIMGAGRSVGNDLEGTFYDLKFFRDGSKNPRISTEVGQDPPQFYAALERFFTSGWDPAAFNTFYQAPHKLYATQMFIPSTQSRMAPPMFGVGDDVEPSLWLVHYKGKIAHKTGGTFRFSGFGDDVFVIRLDGEVVLNASHSDRTWIRDMLGGWKSTSKDNLKRIIGGGASRIGHWFTLEPGIPVEMEVLISEVPGGTFQMSLLVEQEGVEYPENYRGDPILPIFKTMPTPAHLIDEITYLMPVDEADLTGGPVFSVY